MKTTFGFLLLTILLSFSACENDTSESLPDAPSAGDLTSTDSWVVSYFFDKDEDETSDFSGYTFYFLENNRFEARFGNQVTAGTWQVNQSSRKVIINIAGASPLDELTDDWLIDTWNDTLLELRDDNDEHDEFLHFQRN